jgi:hypothetical protein
VAKQVKGIGFRTILSSFQGRSQTRDRRLLSVSCPVCPPGTTPSPIGRIFIKYGIRVLSKICQEMFLRG